MKRSVWLIFAVYCLLASAAWIIAPFAEGGSLFERQSILFAVVGTGAFLFSDCKLRSSASRGSWVKLGVSGIGFLGGPTYLIQVAGSGVSSIETSAIFALLPAVVVLVVVIGWDARREGVGREFLVPALVGFGGVLLLLPVEVPGSVRAQLMMVVIFVAAVLVAISGVWLHRLMQGITITEAVVIVCFANAVFLSVCGLASGDFVGGLSNLRTMFSLSACVELIQIILVFWLLREISPVRFAARYLVIPLLTIVEGLFLLRPQVTVRMVVGISLLIGGIAWILFSKQADDEAILSLR
jgi:drug/metabolite transporter (DMT)-like permease